MVRLLKKKTRGVANNVYSRKTLEEKTKKRRRSADFESKGSEVVYAKGKVLAPYTSVTRDGSL